MANQVMTDLEFAQLGPDLAYIRPLKSEKARELFPAYAEEIEKDIVLFLLCSTTGESLSLSDTFSAAVGHASEGELCVVPLQ